MKEGTHETKRLVGRGGGDQAFSFDGMNPSVQGPLGRTIQWNLTGFSFVGEKSMLDGFQSPWHVIIKILGGNGAT